MRNNRFGFTLAEVLITLGIIGVVAALTIPALMNSTQDKEYRVALKKTFSILSQATMSMVHENGGTLKALCPDGDSTCLQDAYLPYLSTTKTCANGVYGCYTSGANTLKTLSGVVAGFGPDTGAILSDGAGVDFYQIKSNCDGTGDGGTALCGELYVDVNGPYKKPNTYGKDLFIFYIKSNGIAPAGGPGDTAYCDTTNWPQGYGCAAKYLSD